MVRSPPLNRTNNDQISTKNPWGEKRVIYSNVEAQVNEVQFARSRLSGIDMRTARSLPSRAFLRAHFGEVQVKSHSFSRTLDVENKGGEDLWAYILDSAGRMEPVRNAVPDAAMDEGSIVIMKRLDGLMVAAYVVGKEKEQRLVIGPGMACAPFLMGGSPIPLMSASHGDQRKERVAMLLDRRGRSSNEWEHYQAWRPGQVTAAGEGLRSKGRDDEGSDRGGRPARG
ncbi:unnamed protein product, partial [Discosporangium mesarthrocarpum]